MARSLLAEIDEARLVERDSEVVEAAKVCRITLSANWPRPIELSWCLGRGHKRTLIILRPGASVEQPVDKARAWFGPFDLFKVYKECTSEKELEYLGELISVESKRYLDRYDYERLAGEGYKPKMTPTAPHRSPDVTITVLNSDGTEEEPIELHRIYGIGKYDDIVFEEKESLEAITARYEAQLAAKDASAKADIDALKGHVRELTGLVKGFVAGKSVAEVSEVESVPA